MLSPLGRVPRRRPAPRRQLSRRPRRRPLPALVLFAVLALLATGVWWRILNRADPAPAAVDCPSRSVIAALALSPRTVKLRVYNATERAGLAGVVAKQLRGRGFSIALTGNDPLADLQPVEGVGELRYGPAGAGQAQLVKLQLPGVRLAEDERDDAIVDMALGPDFRSLATPAQVRAARQRVLNEADRSSAGARC